MIGIRLKGVNVSSPLVKVPRGTFATGCYVYNRRMPERPKPVSASTPAAPPAAPRPNDDAVICERCGAEMFRMHAVWRCPVCRFKTDCCGW